MPEAKYVTCYLCGSEVFFPREADEVFFGGTKPKYVCRACKSQGSGKCYQRALENIRRAERKKK